MNNTKYIKAKYKQLVRIRIDVYQDLTKKSLLKKKWRFLISYLKKKKKRNKKYCLLNYNLKALTRFPYYRRYRYQKLLYLRKSLRIIYGGLRDSKLKNLALLTKHTSTRDFAQRLEIISFVFLNRIKLTHTLNEGKIQALHGRIYVNGCNKKRYINKGDLLHFSPLFEKLLKRRIVYFFKNLKKNKKNFVILDNAVDFDIDSFRFYFLDNIKHFRCHPFNIRFDKLYTWYNHV